MNPYDYIIIGSGFGGSVSAMRLSEKGYSVCVLEKGKRYADEDFPKSNRNMRKYLWMPNIKFYGPQNMAFFSKALVLGGVGVGGGSLIYANTHMVPSDPFFNNPVWSGLNDWKKILAPFYDKAKFMLGSVPITQFNREDEILKEIATEMGRESSFKGVNVGVYFGDEKKETDPYFNGLGPMRNGCRNCAGCMIGCRYNAKNTLEKNYLWFAEKSGTEIFPETLVTKIEYHDGQYKIHTRKSTSWLPAERKVYVSKKLIISGGVLGTLDLLLKQKYHYKTLPNLSDELGKNIRTNSKSICGVTGARERLNNGVAITSIFAPDENTHIEIVKYPDLSDGMRALSTLLTGKGNRFVRIMKMFGNIIAHPVNYWKLQFGKNWATNSILIMVMQTIDSSMKMVLRKFPFPRITLKYAEGPKPPTYQEIGQQVTKRYAEKVGGIPANAITEILFNMSTADHILGGCPMGTSKENGVVDKEFKVFGYPDMHILDGTIIPCNLGVNPSLTITALSEYAMSLIPEKEGNTKKSLEESVSATL